ncbi:MAG: PQQ-binding-like beta-propeller repeat protein [Mariniphaga sp.]
MAKLLSFVSIITLLFMFQNIVRAENWPGWRGPSGDGTSSEINLPVKWDSTTNVMWKVPVPGIGYASPIVWGDRLFTITAMTETHEKQLLCYDAKTGNLLWQVTVIKSPFESKHSDNSFASGTPVTDGTSVYVSLLDGDSVVVAAYDFSGKQLWIKRPGTYSSPHGYSVSPILYKDKVIINEDCKGDAFLAALSRTDGRTLWKTKFDKRSHSFSTPIIRDIAGKKQMIVCGNMEVASFNPDDGSRNWFATGPSEDFASSPVYSEQSGLVLISSGWPKRIIYALKPDGSGDVTKTHIAWQTADGAFYVPSPVTAGAYLITTSINGSVNCIEAATGKILWKENLGKQYGSAVLAGGLVYMPSDQGIITVIKPGATYEVIAKNNIGETLLASPAISNGMIYLRSANHLFCIGPKGKN